MDAKLEQIKIYEYALNQIKQYRTNCENNAISTVFLLPLPVADGNESIYNDLYDDVIQRLYIYHQELVEENSCDAYTLCENYIAKNIDVFLWLSKDFLLDTMAFNNTIKHNENKVKVI